MQDIAVLITTFLRDECLFRCIHSIRKYYPSIPIYVGDNGRHTNEKRQFCRDNNCEYLELPFDLGVGGTRNEAIRQLPDSIKYLVIVEDDCVFSRKSKLENWYRIFQKDSQIGIVGGLLKLSDTEAQHYEGNHRIEGNIKFCDKIINPDWHEAGGIKYFYCDLVLNVFMMRLDLWRGGSEVCRDPIQWDPQFKTALEHADFFITVKYKLTKGCPVRRRKAWRIVYTPDVWIYHKHESPSIEYKQFRDRKVGFTLFGKKWNLMYSFSDYNRQNPTLYRTGVKKPPDFDVKDFILETAIGILTKHKIRWWLMSGSCLGAIRENDYIKGDTDIDIGIAPNQEKHWERLINEFTKRGFTLYKDWLHKDKKIELTFQKYGTKIDLFFYKKKPKENRLWYGAFGPDQFERWGSFMELMPRSVPSELFRNLKKIRFRGMPCFVPNPPERFLAEIYGKDWRTPKKNWKYWKDCKALDLDLVDRQIKIFIFDVWDKVGKAEVELLAGIRKLGNDLTVGILTDDAIEKAGLHVTNPYRKRCRNIEKLRVVDRTIEINSFAFARDLQRLSFVPQYYISFEGDDPGSLEYLGIFNCQVVSIGDIRKKGIKIRTKKKRGGRIAIGIKTFLREENFYRTLETIEANFPYPYILYIADDGGVSEEKEEIYKKLEKEGHRVFRLPFNSGVSHGRNKIVDAVKEDYVLIMDDDIGINNSSIIKDMKRVLDKKDNIGIAAGVLKHELSGKTFGNDNYSRGIDLEIKDGVLHRYSTKNPIEEIAGVRCRQSDQVINFFFAKREVFDSVRWDSQIKVEYEHMDFFLEFKKTPWQAVICFDAVATHLHPVPHDMEYARYRRSAPKEYFYKKHGIGNIINHWATERRICQTEG